MAARTRLTNASHPPNPALTAFMYVQWALPLAVIAFPVLAGVVAWIELGHWPRPFYDDPKGLNLGVGILFICWLFSTLAMLITLPSALILTPIYAYRRWGRVMSFVCTVLFIVAWVSAYLIGNSDPWYLGAWLFD